MKGGVVDWLETEDREVRKLLAELIGEAFTDGDVEIINGVVAAYLDRLATIDATTGLPPRLIEFRRQSGPLYARAAVAEAKGRK